MPEFISIHIATPPHTKWGAPVAVSYEIIVSKTFDTVLLFQYAETVGTNYSERNISSVKAQIVLCEFIFRHNQMLKSSDDRRHQLAFSQTFC